MAVPGSRYCLVSCIPARLRSADLRSYFSQAVEAGAFLCFHYRHRPERGAADPSSASSCCCLAEVRPGWSRRLVRMYSGKGWVDARGVALPGRCLVRRVRVSPDEGKAASRTKAGAGERLDLGRRGATPQPLWQHRSRAWFGSSPRPWPTWDQDGHLESGSQCLKEPGPSL